MRILLTILLVSPPMFTAAATTFAADPIRTPADLPLTYRSEVDGSTQPYRVYLPSAYDGKRRLPLFVALHGTGGDQNKYFDHPTYGNGIYIKEVEKRGIVLVCPHGRGTTEYRGVGEHDVFSVIREVCRKFLIDEDRIICSGQSMGGTGTTYLCCRYPDVFAAGVPLASTYGHISLVYNLRHVPMFYVHGGKDWPVYAKEGPLPITKEMQRLGYNGRLWMIPDSPHNTMSVSTAAVLDWSLKQKRVAHPRRVTFRAYFPIHGKAYWVEIQEIERIGYFAEIDASAQPDNTILASIKNAKRIALRPESELLKLGEPIRVVVNGREAFAGRCSAKEEIRLALGNGAWTGTVGPRKVRPPTAYRTHKIGTVVVPPEQPRYCDTSGGKMRRLPPPPEGVAETSMGSWMADMMRDATGADVAIYSRRHYRGIPLTEGQDVFIIDLFDWIRPSNCNLSTFEISGGGLLEIIEDNIRNSKKEVEFLLQVSGCRYEFDRSRPKGKRIVQTDLEPDRNYTVVCQRGILGRGDKCFLAGHFEKIPYENLEITNISAAWRYIHKCGGRIEGKLDGRVKEVSPPH